MGAKTRRPFVPVVVIGSGFSGIGMACRLQQSFKHADFVIYERSETFGGTWWNNQYPGCGVDIPSIFYCLSFYPDRTFKTLFSDQPGVRRYLETVVKAFDLERRMRFRTEWKGATFNEHSKTWLSTFLDLNTGEYFEQESTLVFSATGGLVFPKECDIDGAKEFAGKIVHTGAWDHSTELKDKSVVVVGNGCSATQVIPAIVDDVKEINQFIRSPQYYFPMYNPVITGRWRWMIDNVPWFLWYLRMRMFFGMEAGFKSFYLTDEAAAQRELIKAGSAAYVKAVAPEEYWPLLTPKYDPGCKRRILDPGYLACLKRENVHMTDDPISKIEEKSVVTRSGKSYPAEVIILASGYDTTKERIRILGRRGTSLIDHWKGFGGAEAYSSIAMHDFPNLFLIFGPNSGAGHHSSVYAIENAIELILKIAGPVLAGKCDAVEVNADAEASYSKMIQSALKQRVWNGACRSYYVDQATGWNASLYPFSSYRMWWNARFPTWAHWSYQYNEKYLSKRRTRRIVSGTVAAAAAVAGYLYYADKLPESIKNAISV